MSKSILLLALAVFLQVVACKNIPEETDKKSDEDFAKEAADAIDATLLSIKNNFFQFAHDSNRMNEMLLQFSDSIGKHAPKSDNQVDLQEEVHNNLKEMTMKANKTLHESISKNGKM